MGIFRERCEAFLAEERPNWPGWLAVALGLGIAGYFALPIEPPLWVGMGLVLSGAAAALAVRRSALALIAVVALLAVSVGFDAAQIRTRLIAAPQLQEPIRFAHVTGRLIGIEPLPIGMRATFDGVAIAGLAPAKTPARVQLKLIKGAGDLRLGDHLDMLANLQPPSPPEAPGAFDFRRQSYFRQLGASGFVLGAPRFLQKAARDSFAGRFTLWVGRLRSDIGRRIAALEPNEAGALARALTVGDQTALSQSDINAMRVSGLAHLLSISGLHIGMAAGLFFFGLRGLLALIPRLALRHPIKKWSAAAAIFAAGFYSLLAGVSVPTERSFVMIAVVFLGVILDRSPFSIRMLAWAAIAVLLLQPESLTGASFQMSFFAVLGLIAAFEWLRGPLAKWRGGGAAATDWFGRVTRLVRAAGFWLLSMTLTSCVATIMTGPFALYHFDRLSTYGVIANMAAIPLTGFVVMPMGMAALLLMPFGLDAAFWHAMAWGCAGILWIARTVTAWPFAVVLAPAMPTLGLAAIAVGLVTLCLMRSRWRLSGLVPVILGFATIFVIPAPDLLISGDGRLIAAKDANGAYLLNSRRVAKLTAATWLRRNGQADAAKFPDPGSAVQGRLACNVYGCVYARDGKTVVLALVGDALAEACRRADLVVSPHPVQRACAGPGATIDGADLRRGGAHAIWIARGGRIHIESVAATLGDRPWVLERMRQGIRGGQLISDPPAGIAGMDADISEESGQTGSASSAE